MRERLPATGCDHGFGFLQQQVRCRVPVREFAVQVEGGFDFARLAQQARAAPEQIFEVGFRELAPGARAQEALEQGVKLVAALGARTPLREEVAAIEEVELLYGLVVAAYRVRRRQPRHGCSG